jgi:hypothetical protein
MPPGVPRLLLHDVRNPFTKAFNFFDVELKINCAQVVKLHGGSEPQSNEFTRGPPELAQHFRL